MVNGKVSLTQNTNFATCRAKNTFFSRIISTTNGIEIGDTSFFAIQFPIHMCNYLSKRSIKNFVCWKKTFWKFILLYVMSILRINQITFCFAAFFVVSGMFSWFSYYNAIFSSWWIYWCGNDDIRIFITSSNALNIKFYIECYL